MPRYASQTTVAVERTRAEIESVLIRYGAQEFNSGWKEGEAMVAFRIRSLAVRFTLPIPPKTEKRFWVKKTPRGQIAKRTENQAEAAWEQERRQRWRALLLVIKAKLEAVECSVSTIEQEFLAFIVLANGDCLGEWIMDNAMPAIRAGTMPRMLGPAAEDAEFVVNDPPGV